MLQHESALLQAAADAAEAEHAAREAQYAAQLAVAAAKAADLQVWAYVIRWQLRFLQSHTSQLHRAALSTRSAGVVTTSKVAGKQEELARSEERRMALEEMARQSLTAISLSDDAQSATAQQWRSLQRETMWLRAKICVLAHFCKVLRQRLTAAEQKHADITLAVG